MMLRIIAFILTLFIPCQLEAAVKFAAWTSAGSTTGNNVTTPTMISSNATLLVACVASNQTDGTLSDSKSNTWTALTLREANGVRSRIYYVLNPATDGAHTFTYSTTGGMPSIIVNAYTGTVLTSAFDVENGATATGTTIQPGSVTPSVNDALLVSCLTAEAATTTSVNSGFNWSTFSHADGVNFVADQHMLGAISYRIQTTAAAVNPTYTVGTSTDVAATIAVFKPETGQAQGWPPKSGATLPTTCVDGQVFFQTAATTTTMWTCTGIGNRWEQVRGGGMKVINVTDFGARCDGVTDDTAALQRAFDAADTSPVSKIHLPAGTCVFTSPLIVGNDYQSYSHVSIEGSGEDTTTLAHAGADTDVGLQIRHNSYFEMSYFQVKRSGSRGTTTGVLLDRATWDPSGNGTQNTTGTFRHFFVYGFDTGMTMSQAAASSEIACWHCGFANNTTGWTAGPNLNALNYWFFFLGMSGNDCGMYLYSESPHIWGGHSANNRKDFCFAAPFGTLTIENFRSESCYQSTDKFMDGAVNKLVMRNSSITRGTACDPLISISGPELVLENNHIEGKITITGSGMATLRMHGNTGIVAAADGRPITISGQRATKIDLQNNRASTGLPFKDEEGLWTVAATMTPWVTHLRSETDTAAGGTSLNSLRSIGYGSATAGRNIRDQGTFATSNTLAYTFKKTVTVTTTNGSTDITFTAGVITANDVGKQIAIPLGIDSGNCFGQTDQTFYARISQLLSSTSARLVAAQWHDAWTTRCRPDAYPNITGAQANTVIGEDEPDANYFITGLSCNAQETVSWSNKATTGFTLTSSNGSSTASCDFMIVR